jgi:uncharacterized protein YecE (DUF72 family)
MDFGRIKEFDAAKLSLSADHRSVAKVLGGTRVQRPVAYVGGVLWSDESFLGTIYPSKARPKDYVKYYTRQFNTIELNLTHYRTPDAVTVQRWYEVSPPGFKFCPKVHQDISHSNNLLTRVNYHNECDELYDLLKEKRGMRFLQLPPVFSPDRLSELLEFLDKSRQRDLAVELRHPLWFSREAELNSLSNYLYKNNMSLVLTDTPGRRDVLHMRLTSKTAFIRFNAHDNHPSDKIRLDEWAKRLGAWFEAGLETCYFFVHTPKQVHMPHLVTYFTQKLFKESGIKVTPPDIKSPGQIADNLFDWGA